MAVPRESEKSQSTSDEFEVFVAVTELGLRRALIAAYGVEVGRDAAVDALVWAWQHWWRVERMDNPGGYLYRVGQSAARRRIRHDARTAIVHTTLPEAPGSPDIEPALEGAVMRLSARQRAAVLLVHGYGYSLSETARVMGCSVSSVRNHTRRGLAHLRDFLGGVDES